MIISKHKVGAFLNFNLIPVIEQMGADLVEKTEILEQGVEGVAFRCHLKAPVLPLFVHLRITRSGDTFHVANVEDDYPAVQLFFQDAYCTLRFLDEDTAELGGNFSLRGVPSAVERGIRKLILEVATRLKVFIESV
jgi:hypothetical protein